MPAYLPFTGVSVLQIIFLFFMHENNLRKTLIPSSGIEKNPDLFPVYRG